MDSLTTLFEDLYGGKRKNHSKEAREFADLRRDATERKNGSANRLENMKKWVHFPTYFRFQTARKATDASAELKWNVTES